MTKVAICQSNYIPWKGYFDLIRQADVFVFYDIVQYTKNDWRNRNKIKTPNGPHWLTIPVLHKSLDQRIEEVEIANSLWKEKHWKTIKQNYSKSPYFSCYEDIFFTEYQKEWSNLSTLNQAMIVRICSLLGIETTLLSASTMDLPEDRIQRLISICKMFNASEYISGPAAKSYLDVDLFKRHGIDVRWMDYNNYKVYNQLYEPFDHYVSILDLLFNTGPSALDYL